MGSFRYYLIGGLLGLAAGIGIGNFIGYDDTRERSLPKCVYVDPNGMACQVYSIDGTYTHMKKNEYNPNLPFRRPVDILGDEIFKLDREKTTLEKEKARLE